MSAGRPLPQCTPCEHVVLASSHVAAAVGSDDSLPAATRARLSALAEELEFIAGALALDVSPGGMNG